MKIDLNKIKKLIEVSEKKELSQKDSEQLAIMKRAVELIEYVGTNFDLFEDMQKQEEKELIMEGLVCIAKGKNGEFSFSSN